jgi:hypothetical protein
MLATNTSPSGLALAHQGQMAVQVTYGGHESGVVKGDPTADAVQPQCGANLHGGRLTRRVVRCRGSCFDRSHIGLHGFFDAGASSMKLRTNGHLAQVHAE